MKSYKPNNGSAASVGLASWTAMALFINMRVLKCTVLQDRLLLHTAQMSIIEARGHDYAMKYSENQYVIQHHTLESRKLTAT